MPQSETSQSGHQSYHNGHMPVWLCLWQANRTGRKFATNTKDRKALAAMPDELTIYRGFSRSRKAVDGLAWTLDREQAEWFANRNRYGRQHGYIASATIRKSDILAYLNDGGRNEQEILCLAEHRQNVQIERYNANSFSNIL